MGDATDMERLLAILREQPAVDSRAIARIHDALREVAYEGGPTGILAWLVRPRPVHVSPAQAFSGALLAVLLGAVGLELFRNVVTGVDHSVAHAPLHPVRFVFMAPEAGSVSLAGDFNDWDLSMTPLQRMNADGIWSVVVPLEAGQYTYSFVVDGTTWRPDPSAPVAAAEDFGRPSSVLLVSNR